MCSVVAKDIPSLDQRYHSLRTAIEGRCSGSGSRLNDIANHLLNAVADWERFVKYNCEGDECARIYDDLQKHREYLESQINSDAPNRLTG